MAGTAEREIVSPQTPPCEIQLRQAATMPDPNEGDATVKSGQQIQSQHIQELQHNLNRHSCTWTGPGSVLIDTFKRCDLFTVCQSTKWQERTNMWTQPLKYNSCNIFFLKGQLCFSFNAGTVLYFVPWWWYACAKLEQSYPLIFWWHS